MITHDNFCVFILTNGRPNNVKTLSALKRAGYTGKIYLVVDNLDKTAEEYKKNFGDKVIIFDKAEVAAYTDSGDNFNNWKAIIYARNACFNIAKQLNIEYFIQLDDDYQKFQYRRDISGEYSYKGMTNMDMVFNAMLDFYKSVPNLLSISMAQGGDFIGGSEGQHAQKRTLIRKCMNSFLCSVHRPFLFFGKINEDVNTYTNLASKGGLFLTTTDISLVQTQSQKQSGGMTGLYLDGGTYVKSFYSVMYQPSSVKISCMGNKDYRIHHSVTWRNTTPVILSEDFKKK